MKNKTASMVCTIILGVIFLGLLLIPSFINLGSNKTETLKIKVAVEAVEYKRTYAFIPMTKSVYYVAVLEDDSIAIVRGNKNWYEKNFTSLGYAKNGGYVTVEGKLDKMNSKVYSKMTGVYAILSVGSNVDYAYDKTQYVDGLTKPFAVKGIIAGVVAIALCIVYVLALKKNWLQKSSIIIALAVCTIADLIFGIHVILGR